MGIIIKNTNPEIPIRIRFSRKPKPFFSRQITKDEMKLVNERYDRELDALRVKLDAAHSREGIAYEPRDLRKDVERQIAAIVRGETDSEPFYKNLLDHMVVQKDKRVEVYLSRLPQKWMFILENLRRAPVCQNDPSVPISVSSPFSSG